MKPIFLDDYGHVAKSRFALPSDMMSHVGTRVSSW
jgi:hypothetical protein